MTRTTPRFFAPDEQTPAQLSQGWVEGDVFAYLLEDGRMFSVEAIGVDDEGRLIRGQRIDHPEERFGPEIAAFYSRRDKTKQVLRFYAFSTLRAKREDGGRYAVEALKAYEDSA